MNIEEIHNKKLENLMPIEFSVDKDFCDVPDPLPRQSAHCLFIGPPRVGKSSLMLQWLLNKKPKLYRKCFDNVLVVAPTQSLKSIKEQPFADHDQEKMFTDLDHETMSTILAKIKEWAADELNTLLILDDQTAHLKDNEVQKLYNELSFNRRHYRCTIWNCIQVYNQTPLPVRKSATHLIVFKTPIQEFDTIMNETLSYTKEIARSLYNYVFKRAHEFLLINVPTGQLYRKYNLLQFS